MNAYMHSLRLSTNSAHVAHATTIGKHMQIKEKEREKGQSKLPMIYLFVKNRLRQGSCVNLG